MGGFAVGKDIIYRIITTILLINTLLGRFNNCYIRILHPLNRQVRYNLAIKNNS